MTEPSLSRAEAARKSAAAIKRQWRRGETPDAAAALKAHPELADNQSVVLELAYEEYLLREQAGEAPSPASFAAQFPGFRAAVKSVIAAHQQFLDQPDVVAGDDWPEVGATVAGVELVAVLGTGAFGRAYLAYEPELERVCVLKLTTGVSDEAKVIARLDHPHVIEVKWAKAVDGRTAVCMPLVGVNTLAEVFAAIPEGGPPASADVILAAADADDPGDRAARGAEAVVRAGEPYLVGAAAVAGRVADAVAYLHEMGVTHGDLKPANVVLGRGGAPFLIDFNLSTRGAGPAAVRGSPGYMAPELLDAVAADPLATGADLARADLFSLGVVVFELLAGRRPFPAADPKSFAAQAAAARTPLPAFPAGLSRKVERELALYLSPDPAARPATAAALAAALNQFVTAARIPPVPVWSWRRVASAVVGLGLLLAAVGAGGTAIQPPELSPAPTLPPPPAPPTTAAEFITRGLAKMRAEDWPGARADFTEANARRPSRWAVAMIAYCCAAGGKHEEAIEFSRWLDKNGNATPDVLNNLAYSLLQGPRPGEAAEPLDRALAGEPGMPAALYNRAMLRFKAKINGAIDPSAVADIRAVLAIWPGSAELRFDAARVYAAASEDDPKLRAEALEEVRAGVELGKRAALFRSDPTLRARFRTGFGSALAFEAACAVPPDPSPSLIKSSWRVQLAEPRSFP